MKRFIKNVLYTIEDISFYVLSAVFVLYLVFIMWSLSVNYMPHVNPANYPEHIDYGILSDEQIETFNDILYAVEHEESVVECPIYTDREQHEISTQLGLHFGTIEGVEELIRWNNDSANLSLDMFKLLSNQKIIVDSRIDEAVSTMMEGSDEFKLWQISNYISKKMTYTDVYRNTIAMLNGEGVCSAYAILFYKMATRVGIETYICCGYANEIYHAWNMVELDGECLYYDITWYDDFVRDIRYVFSRSSWDRYYQINNVWVTDLNS